jgi:hypothetical protein
MASSNALRRLSWSLRLLGVTLALTAVARQSVAESRPLSAASTADVLAGKEIFDAQCALCHGAGGSGGTGPDLRRPRLLHARNDDPSSSTTRSSSTSEAAPGRPLAGVVFLIAAFGCSLAYVRMGRRVA